MVNLLLNSLITAIYFLSYHPDDLWVHSLREHPPSRRDVVHDLVEGGPLDLLALEVRDGVHEVEAHAALAELPDEQVLLLGGGDVWKKS